MIFWNIRKFVLDLMCCNLSELLAILIAALLGFPLPLLPLPILFLNVVTDIFPAFALGACGGSKEIKNTPPRDADEPIPTRTLDRTRDVWSDDLGRDDRCIRDRGGYAGGMEANEVVAMSFLTIAFAHLWHVFNMRELTSGIVRNEVTENAYVWGSLGLSALLVIDTVYLPGSCWH